MLLLQMTHLYWLTKPASNIARIAPLGRGQTTTVWLRTQTNPHRLVAGVVAIVSMMTIAHRMTPIVQTIPMTLTRVRLNGPQATVFTQHCGTIVTTFGQGYHQPESTHKQISPFSTLHWYLRKYSRTIGR